MRIILPKELIKNKEITISGEKARYLISVLRCNVGDSLQILDGEGNSYNSKIVGLESKKVFVVISEKSAFQTESQLNLILVQGILKGEKMDLVIQKSTELGVKEIIPVITERSQIRHTRKLVRWRKIAEEASKQSGRTVVPVVHEPIEFNNFINNITPPSPPLNLRGGWKGLKGFIFWEEGGLPLKEAIKHSAVSIQHSENSQLFILVGPEGGFTKEEVSLAESKGLVVASLGKRILRAETAAIAAVALIQFSLGDI